MKRLFCLLLLFSALACKSKTERAIIGKWNAAGLIECGDTVQFQMDQVNLQLMGSGRYIYNSTLNVHEEGKYWIKESYLYTKDLINPKATEKVVRISLLDHDSLVLDMNYKGKDQSLTLIRHN